MIQNLLHLGIALMAMSWQADGIAAQTPDCLEASEKAVAIKYKSKKWVKSGSWHRTLTDRDADLYTDAIPYWSRRRKESDRIAHRTVHSDGSVDLVFCQFGGFGDAFESFYICESPLHLSLPACSPGKIDPIFFDDDIEEADLKKLSREWIVAVSEQVPLSLEALVHWRELAQKENALLRVLNFDDENQLVSIDGKKAQGVSLDSTVAFAFQMGLLNHFPNAAIFENGRYLGLISGYKDRRWYAEFLSDLRAQDRFQETDDSSYRARIRETLSTLSQVRYELTYEPVIELKELPYFGSYFRPFFEKDLFPFPMDKEQLAYLFNLTTRTHRFLDYKKLNLTGPYDLTTLPGSESILLAFHKNRSISLVDSANDQVIYHDQSGSIYPSAALLNQDAEGKTYRMITNWGPTYVREFKVREDLDGRRVEDMTPAMRICENQSISTPHVTAFGRHLTGTKSGFAALFRINEDRSCSVALNLAVSASKIDTHPDESRFAFHSSYYSFEPNKVTSRRGGNFLFDGPTRRIQHLNARIHARLPNMFAHYYPSFLAGDRISLQRRAGDYPNRVSQMQVLRYKRIVTPSLHRHSLKH